MDNQGQEIKKYEPRSSKEINQIAALVKSAIGFDESRGDIIEVQNIELNSSSFEEDTQYFVKNEKQQFIQNLINKGIMGLAILIAFMVVRSLFKNVSRNVQLTPLPVTHRAIAAGANAPQQLGPEEELSEDMYIKRLSPEAKAKLKAKDKMTTEVVDYVKGSPEDATKLIRSWLTQPSS